MHETNDNNTNGNGNNEADNIGRLIRHVGAREGVPEERLHRSREKVFGHWEQVVREQRQPATRPRLFSLARVAGIAVVATVAVVLIGRGFTPGPLQTVAHVERVIGAINVDGTPLVDGQALVSGTSLRTPQGARAALRLSTGQALRIDQETTLMFEAADQLMLDSGAIFIDTAGAEAAEPLRVVTPLGTARDIGTQFQVRLSGSVMLIGVRDGLVEIDRKGEELRAVNAGYQIWFAAAGESAIEPLDTDTPDWRWIDSVAPEFNLDGASLAEYLDWYANENGLQLVYADDGSRQRAKRITLTGGHGAIGPDQGLEAIQRIAPFEFRREDDRLQVKVD